MPENPLQSKDLGFYFALGQVGLEMVVPIAVGVYLDDWLGWSPWATMPWCRDARTTSARSS